MLKYILLIFIAIAAWPITLVCLFIAIVYGIIHALIKNYKKDTRDKKVRAAVPQIHKSLHQDRVLLISVVVSVIKKHWDVLEDKAEQYTDEDDYGNLSVHTGFKQEFIYFSEKVVLPALEEHIDNDETKNKNVTLILADTIRALTNMPIDISYNDDNRVIANKLLSAIDNSLMDDDLLYALRNDSVAMDSYLNEATIIFMKNPSIELSFGEKLKTSQPIWVTPFVALVLQIFFVMHNNKNNSTAKDHRDAKTFSGNDPYGYEEFIKTLLRDNGFSAKRTRGSGDYGVDVLASKNNKTFAIQCKLYNHTVGFKAVQEIVGGRIYYKTDFAVVVSDNSFTDAAKNMARRSDVILTHHKNLLHKLESLIPEEDETHKDGETTELVDNQTSQEIVVKKQWTQQDADELITVILPTINDKK